MSVHGGDEFDMTLLASAAESSPVAPTGPPARTRRFQPGTLVWLAPAGALLLGLFIVPSWAVILESRAEYVKWSLQSVRPQPKAGAASVVWTA